MRLYFPVALTGNLIRIEKLVLGGIWTGDLPIFNPNVLTSALSRQILLIKDCGPRNLEHRLQIYADLEAFKIYLMISLLLFWVLKSVSCYFKFSDQSLVILSSQISLLLF